MNDKDRDRLATWIAARLAARGLTTADVTDATIAAWLEEILATGVLSPAGVEEAFAAGLTTYVEDVLTTPVSDAGRN